MRNSASHSYFISWSCFSGFHQPIHIDRLKMLLHLWKLSIRSNRRLRNYIAGNISPSSPNVACKSPLAKSIIAVSFLFVCVCVRTYVIVSPCSFVLEPLIVQLLIYWCMPKRYSNMYTFHATIALFIALFLLTIQLRERWERLKARKIYVHFTPLGLSSFFHWLDHKTLFYGRFCKWPDQWRYESITQICCYSFRIWNTCQLDGWNVSEQVAPVPLVRFSICFYL